MEEQSEQGTSMPSEQEAFQSALDMVEAEAGQTTDAFSKAQTDVLEESQPPQDIDSDETPDAGDDKKETHEDQEGDPEDSALNKSWNTIRQKEQRLRREREELREQLNQLRVLQQNKAPVKQEGSSPDIELLRDNPLEFFEKAGVSFDKVADKIISGGQKTPDDIERNVTSKLSELEQRYQQMEQRLVDSQTNLLHHQYTNQAHIALNNPDFEVLKVHPNATQEIAARAMEAARNGEVVDVSSIANSLTNEFKESLKSLMSHKAVVNALGTGEVSGEQVAKQAAKDIEKAQNTPQKRTSEPTITNSMSSAPLKDLTPATFDNLSDHEKINEVLKYMTD